MTGLPASAWLVLTAFLAQEPSTSGPPVTAPDLAPTPTSGVTATPAPRPTPREIGVGGNSLADIARRNRAEKERETKKKSLGVISNETLRKGGAAPSPAAKGADKAPARPAAVPAAIPEWRDFRGRNEADWRKLSTDLKIRLEAAEGQARRLDNEVRRLENDFYAWSDGNYRDRVIKPALDQARGDLDKARRDADEARTRIANLEDEARKSGASPGWIR